MPGPAQPAAATDARVVRTRNDVLRVAIGLLLDEGWDALTHARVAREAGYAKATLYAHWPTRRDLVLDAFSRFAETPHHAPTGDLRHDLVEELVSFRTAMLEHRLDRVLAVLVDLTHAMPELVAVRDQLVTDGEAVVRDLLAPVATGPELEAATLMLCGAVLHAALLHGAPPDEAGIAAGVDLVLAGIGVRPPPGGDGGPSMS